LPDDERDKLQGELTREIARSPVLSEFGARVQFLRGRFTVERPTADGVEVWARITPLAADLLLEVERRSWQEVARGSARKVIKALAGDTEGTFHGMGSLDASLRKAGQGLARLPLEVQDGKFVYTGTGKRGSVQETLFHYFGLPIEVIAQPEAWYSYHRTPHIVASTKNRTRVLVRFEADSQYGSFGGTCLYALRFGRWGAYPIKPSASDSITTAEAWLVKRKWQAWC
jgi:hypothetical protein